MSARQSDALIHFVREHPGALALALALDSTDCVAVAHTVDIILKNGPLDHVVYCAGRYQEMRATAFDLDEMLRHEQVNYSGALMVLAAVLPHFLERSKSLAVVPGKPLAIAAGHISLVSSVAGFRGLPKSLAYGPTKAALINLAETLYLDLHSSGIGVSLINLCANTAHGEQPVQDAGLDHLGTGGARDHSRLGAWRI